MGIDQEVVDRYAQFHKEIKANQKRLLDSWQTSLRSAGHLFSSLPERHLSRYLDPAGGFRIYHKDWEGMHEGLKAFFDGNTSADRFFIYLRGYQYYYCDPSMYHAGSRPRPIELWKKLMVKWYDYKHHTQILLCLRDKLSFVDFVGIISFLEWMFNDLSSMMWACMQMEGKVPVSCKKALETAADQLSEVIVGIAYHSWRHGQPVDAAYIFARISRIVQDREIAHFLQKMEQILLVESRSVVRAVREGDQLWLVLAAGETKFGPWLHQLPNKKIDLLNNAFGAMNLGFFIKHQYTCNTNIAVDNIYYSLHEAEMHRYDQTPCFLYSHGPRQDAYTIVVDDSLFTGHTFYCIVKQLETVTDDIACLPITFDVATIFNHPEEIGTDNLAQKIDRIEACVRTIGGNLTVARSYWVFRKRRKYRSYPYDEEYDKTINGSDILMSLLWRRFRREINGY